MNTKEQILEKIEEATRQANKEYSPWMFGYLNGLVTAAKIMGITEKEIGEAEDKGLDK